MRGIEPYKEIIMIKKTNKEMRNVKDLFYSTLFVFITLPWVYMCVVLMLLIVLNWKV